jgi:hypothetical protein
MIDFARGIKHVSLPDDFAQKSWENWKVFSSIMTYQRILIKKNRLLKYTTWMKE